MSERVAGRSRGHDRGRTRDLRPAHAVGVCTHGGSARRCKGECEVDLGHLHEKLVQDWRCKVDVTNDVDSTIRRVLDTGLPEAPYTPDIFTTKVLLAFDHALTSYGDNGETVCDPPRVEIGFHQCVAANTDAPLDLDKIADDVVARIHGDPSFAAHVVAQLSGTVERARDA